MYGIKTTWKRIRIMTTTIENMSRRQADDKWLIPLIMKAMQIETTAIHQDTLIRTPVLFLPYITKNVVSSNCQGGRKGLFGLTLEGIYSPT